MRIFHHISSLIAAAFLITTPHLARATTCNLESIPAIPLEGAVVSARHIAPSTDDEHGVKTPESIGWDARYIVDVDASFDFRGGTIPFAVPLVIEETLLVGEGITPAWSPSGQMTGLCVSPNALRDRTISASFIQPAPADAWSSSDRSISFGIPIAASSVVQIVDSSIDADTRINPLITTTPTSTLERHVGYIAPRSIGHDAREEARRLTDTKVHMTTTPIYVRGDDLRAMNGIQGHITSPRAHSKGTAIGIGILFAGLVSALIVAARRLKNAASEEHADALLASRIDDLRSTRKEEAI